MDFFLRGGKKRSGSLLFGLLVCCRDGLGKQNRERSAESLAAKKKEAHGTITRASVHLNQYFAYLRDHLLLGKNADIHRDYKSISREVQRQDVYPTPFDLTTVRDPDFSPNSRANLG
jgi:hypothetical protein